MKQKLPVKLCMCAIVSLVVVDVLLMCIFLAVKRTHKNINTLDFVLHADMALYVQVLHTISLSEWLHTCSRRQ